MPKRRPTRRPPVKTTAVRFPAPPDVPPSQRGATSVPLRYEDVTQDGRLQLDALAPALGDVVWRQLLAAHPAAGPMREQGIVPILSRLVMEGGKGPHSTDHPMQASGLYDFAHVLGTDGGVERLVVNMWVEGRLPVGHNFFPPPEGAGSLIPVGRLFAEHVLTRLFAEPSERKVTKLSLPGIAEVPGRPVPAVTPASLLALPDGATALEPGLSPDAVLLVFGLAHTDSNQHVNSLVYPRLFEEAALRRLAGLGKLPAPVLARFTEAAFRKPCFAGQQVAVVLQAFELGGRLGVLGALVPPEQSRTPAAALKPYCTLRMLFEP